MPAVMPTCRGAASWPCTAHAPAPAAAASAAADAATAMRTTFVRSVTVRSSSAALLELVAELLDRDERVGEQRELFAQPPDVNVHRPRAAGIGVAPHVGEQQIARQHAP